MWRRSAPVGTSGAHSIRLFAGLLLSGLVGCSDAQYGAAGGEGQTDIESGGTTRELTANPYELSWGEFKRRSTTTIDGKTAYVVEWDVRFHSEEELRAYYDGFQRSEKSTVKRVTVNGVVVDDVWAADRRRNLTYCVSTLFAGNQARMIAEMHRATQAWEAVADVNFTYDSSQNANCVDANPAVLFRVRPFVNGGAAAFNPSAPIEQRELIVDIESFDGYLRDKAPNITSEGALRHELGHILGLRHEHIHRDCAVGDDTLPDARLMNRYDQESVMHYPWCSGIRDSRFDITPLDADGASELYGRAPAARAVPYAAANTNSGSTNTEPMVVYLQSGDLLEAGTCGLPGAVFSGDTYLRVRQGASAGGSTEVASNDDSCSGIGSRLSYKAATTGFYTIHAGCYSSGGCSGTVAVKVRPALWTGWFNRDTPSGTGDEEYLSARLAEGNAICKSPLTAECRRVSDKKDWKETGEVLQCSPNLGAACVNSQQADGVCDDYEVRFACASQGAYTPWTNSAAPWWGEGDMERLSILKDPPWGLCDQPIAAECRRVSDGKDWTEAGQKMTCNASGGSLCKNADQTSPFCSDYEVRMVCPAVGVWTPWANVDGPTGNGDGEHLGQHIARGACAKPLGIQCRRRSDKADWTATGQKMLCSPTQGSICLNADQGPGRACDDYEVRFYCAEGAE